MSMLDHSSSAKGSLPPKPPPSVRPPPTPPATAGVPKSASFGSLNSHSNNVATPSSDRSCSMLPPGSHSAPHSAPMGPTFPHVGGSPSPRAFPPHGGYPLPPALPTPYQFPYDLVSPGMPMPPAFSPLQGVPSPCDPPRGLQFDVTSTPDGNPALRIQPPSSSALAQRRHKKKQNQESCIPPASPSDHLTLQSSTKKRRSQKKNSRHFPTPLQEMPGQRFSKRLQGLAAEDSLDFSAVPRSSQGNKHNEMSQPQQITAPQEATAHSAAAWDKNGMQQTASRREPPPPPLPLDTRDPMRRFFDICLDKGVNIFSSEEQAWLCRYIDTNDASQRSLVHRVAKQVLWYNRSHALTYKLVEWVYRHDEGEEGRALVAELLEQRLSEMDFESEGMMDLDEVDELMDCQIVVDSCKAQLQQMKQEVKEQMEVDEQQEGMAV
ncbi:hypothetical protein F5Y04DRAFT_292239 [Hypomontagnella monticulosa]|nr:hypothetical protein F5Y04DRAFT_292239 [Hypomontagnella monticulosa]